MIYGNDTRPYYIATVSRGPWFKDWFVEDDGLEWFYSFLDNDGKKRYLLSNNLQWQDRERMSHLWHTNYRNNKISWFFGLWLSFETVAKVKLFHKIPMGWRLVAGLVLANQYKKVFMHYSSQYYNPVIGAYIRKYEHCVKSDITDISDEKREYFYIDTSQYMNYKLEDLHDEHHINHGNQPDGEVRDSSWLVEVDKFLNNEPNHLKEHKRFLNYPFEFIDKSFPSAEKVADMMHRKD
jgi:hypothetical protein